MANEHGLFWNSQNGDRVYDANDFSEWLKKFYTTGVFNGDLAVTASGGMTVSVSSGYVNIEGKVKLFSTPTTLTIATAGGTYERIDTVVAECNYSDREITVKVVTGAYSASPKATAPVRTAAAYQLVLAEIDVPAGATEITQKNITDMRTDSSVCGLVTGTVSQIDFSTAKAQFDSWFEDVKGTLDSDAAGNLKNQIDAANEKIDTKTKMLTVSGASRANSFIYEYDLGTSYTAEQSADVVAGTFDKVRTGGYWTINGHKYWAGHADYRLHCGDTELTTHHMLVFPDKSFYNAHMNATNVTTGAYYGSNMVSDGLTQALAIVKADFGESHVLTYRNLLANAVSGGSSSNWAWYDRQIDLMNECMVYGNQVWGTQNGYNVGCDKTQIALFQARPDLIVTRENWWLRDVQSSPNFCGVYGGGHAGHWSASNVFGVRPAFLIA